MAAHLGDKLQYLAHHSPADVKAIEVVVDYRIAQYQNREQNKIRESASPRWESLRRPRE